MAKDDKPIILYPAYFDSTRSRAEGRRVPKNLAIPSPRVEEVHSAAKSLGLQAIIDPDRFHSSTPWQKEGRVMIMDNYAKTSIIRKVSEKLKTMRG